MKTITDSLITTAILAGFLVALALALPDSLDGENVDCPLPHLIHNQP